MVDGTSANGLPPKVVCVDDPAVAHCSKVKLGRSTTVAMSAYGNVATTLNALRALFNSTTGDFELLLVDDCSPDQGAVRKLFLQTQLEHPNTRVYAFDRNFEYSGSLNCILSHASGEQVLFLSNDIFITPTYLRGLFAVASANSSHGIVRGCSNFVDNNCATHNVETPKLSTSASLFDFAEEVSRRHGDQFILDDYLTGDAFLVSRAVLNKIGTLDPIFYGYFADHDFGIRARRAGYQLVLARSAYAYHQRDANFSYLSRDEQSRKLERRWVRVIENWARFKLKYGMPVDLLYESINQIPWTDLNNGALTEQCYSPPGDYSRYLL